MLYTYLQSLLYTVLGDCYCKLNGFYKGKDCLLTTYEIMIISNTEEWQKFIEGDRSAFKQLMQDHYKTLYNYGAKYTTDTELVKDCIQELFIGLWNRKVFLSTNVNPKAYLISSLRRALHRKIQSENRISKYQDSINTLSLFDFDISIEEEFINRETDLLKANKIASLIANLPKRQKEVVYLKFFLNLSRDEIAVVMGNNPQTVSNLLQLAFKKLRGDLTRSSLRASQLFLLALAFFHDIF